MIWTTRNSWRAAASAMVALGLVIAVAAAHDGPDVLVVTLDPPKTPQSMRGGVAASLLTNQSSTPQSGATAEVTCQSPQPLGTWSCQNGVWVAGPAPPSGPNGTGPGNCITPSPGAGWSCQSGTWVSAGNDPSNAARAPATGNSQPGDPTLETARAVSCPLPAPAAGWVCQSGTWTSPPASPPSLPTASSNSCPGPAPASGAVCQNGSWIIR